jgi:cytosine/adenosine deaminase-related metal-dependent hydrolase
MSYLKFGAKKIFDGYRFHTQSVLITQADGTIDAIVPQAQAGDDVQQYDGILMPGHINAHCHLELSHLKDVIPPHTGLIEFLCSVVTKREASPKTSLEGGTYEDPAVKKMNAIFAAEKEMFDNGIVAVGDIGNTTDTAAIKSKSRIRWQNFVEVLSFTDEKAEANMLQYKEVLNKMIDDRWADGGRTSTNRQRSSLVPHAPYSISPKTFQLINEATKNQIISIHNQEHPAEDELYKTGGGDYLKLFKIFGIEQSPFPVTGKSSIRSVLPYFNNGQTIFLIHNTYMPEEDIVWANKYAAANGLQLVYCFCINANLYIENKVPPIDLFIKHHCHIVLGTDSYSSNWQLSIAKEIAAIKKHFPHIADETILQWATTNGAKALQWDNALGSFEKGKRPGVVEVNQNIDDSVRIF